jgi:transcriptional regulator with XRE-family HTH domain
MTFAQILRQKMHEQGMNQTALVEKTGLSKGAISQYCNGVIEPKAEARYRLAEALHCTPQDLLTEEKPCHDDYENPEIPTSEAALLLGMSEDRLKARLRNPDCFYGDAVKMSGEHYDYYVNRRRLMAYLLIEVNGWGLFRYAA